MSATWRRRFRCCGRSARRAARDRRRAPSASATPSSGCARRRKLDAPRALAAMLDHLDASGRFALLKLATGRASGRDHRAACQAGAGRCVRARGRSGRGGVARPAPALRRTVRLGRGPRPRSRRSRDVPVFRPFMLAHPLDDDQGLARRLCGRVEMGRDPRPARPCRRRDPALQPHRRRHLAAASPTSPRRSGRRACSTASCWCAGRTRASPTSMAAPRPASTRSSSGSAARTSARRCSAPIPPSSGSTTSCSTATRICASCPGSERRTRLERSRARLDPERFDVSQLIDADSFEALEELRANARDVAIEGIMLKRRDSAYVARPPHRPVVQMEARSADRRLRADVCPARLGQTLELL